MARVEELHTHAKNASLKLSFSQQPLFSTVPTQQGRALLAHQSGASGLHLLQGSSLAAVPTREMTPSSGDHKL